MSTEAAQHTLGVTKDVGGAIFAAMGVGIAAVAVHILGPLQRISTEPAPGATNPAAIGQLLAALAVVTVLLYGVVKLDFENFLSFDLGSLPSLVMKAVVVWFVGGYTTVFVSLILTPQVGTAVAYPVAAGVGFGLALLLQFEPRWWVLNVVALCLAPLFVAVLGRELAPGPILLLLVVLLVYDIVAVHVTGHMVEMAEGVLAWDVTLPIVVKLPLRAPSAGRSEMLLGVGDLVIPASIVTSAALWSPAAPVVAGANLPALWAVGGIAVGHLAMHVLPDRDKPQPGLPFLNTGAIGGYLVGSLLAGVPLAAALGVRAVEVGL